MGGICFHTLGHINRVDYINQPSGLLPNPLCCREKVAIEVQLHNGHDAVTSHQYEAVGRACDHAKEMARQGGVSWRSLWRPPPLLFARSPLLFARAALLFVLNGLFFRAPFFFEQNWPKF